MDTEQTEVATDAAVPIRPQADPAVVDWFLQNFVDSVNQFENEFPVTLQVSGMLVTGTLIASAIYFEEFSKSFAVGSENEERDRAPILSVAKKTREMLAVPNAPLPQFIHLRGAKLYNAAGNAIPGSDEGVLWRGRLTEVHGFFWGKLEQSAPK